jgi:hypothetical protein
LLAPATYFRMPAVEDRPMDVMHAPVRRLKAKATPTSVSPLGTTTKYATVRLVEKKTSFSPRKRRALLFCQSIQAHVSQWPTTILARIANAVNRIRRPTRVLQSIVPIAVVMRSHIRPVWPRGSASRRLCSMQDCREPRLSNSVISQ